MSNISQRSSSPIPFRPGSAPGPTGRRPVEPTSGKKRSLSAPGRIGGVSSPPPKASDNQATGESTQYKTRDKLPPQYQGMPDSTLRALRLIAPMSKEEINALIQRTNTPIDVATPYTRALTSPMDAAKSLHTDLKAAYDSSRTDFSSRKSELQGKINTFLKSLSSSDQEDLSKFSDIRQRTSPGPTSESDVIKLKVGIFIQQLEDRFGLGQPSGDGKSSSEAG